MSVMFHSFSDFNLLSWCQLIDKIHVFVSQWSISASCDITRGWFPQGPVLAPTVWKMPQTKETNLNSKPSWEVDWVSFYTYSWPVVLAMYRYTLGISDALVPEICGFGSCIFIYTLLQWYVGKGRISSLLRWDSNLNLFFLSIRVQAQVRSWGITWDTYGCSSCSVRYFFNSTWLLLY